MTSGPSRTFIGSVICVDLVGYSKRSIAEQSSIKAEFNRLLSLVLKPIRPEDRIILDTGDGVAITFLGDPDDCLNMGLEMRDVLNTNGMKLGTERGAGPVRIGMNLGPVKVALDLNGRPSIVGDGVVVAERIASFALPGQIVASRSFHDMVSRLSDEHLAMFKYEGKHSDKNAREHEIYMVSDPQRVAKPATAPQGGTAEPGPAVGRPVAGSQVVAIAKAPASVKAAEPTPAPLPKRQSPPKAAAPTPTAVRASESAAARDASPQRGSGLAGLLSNPIAVGATAIALLSVIFAEAWMLDQRLRASEPAAPVQTAEAPPKVAASPALSQTPPAQSVERTSVTKSATTSQGVARTQAGVQSSTELTPAMKSALVSLGLAPAEPSPTANKPGAGAPSRSEPTKSQRAVLDPPNVEPPKAGPPSTAVLAAVTPITRVPVTFPRVAAAQGIDSGVVKARLAINAEGRVTEVRILSSAPPNVFDREAVRTLEEWRFNTGAPQRSYEVEIAFKR